MTWLKMASCVRIPATGSHCSFVLLRGLRRVLLEEAINVEHSRLGAVISLLAAGAVVLSGCSVSHTTLAYAHEATVECGGEKILTGSGSSAQGNAMKRFVEAYMNACPGRTLNYATNGSGAG